MKYGERLRVAREHAGLTQKTLAERMGNIVTQANISKLETSDGDGSTYTVQFAVACGVRPEWLAMETGPMLAEYDAKIQRVVTAMQQMPEYRKEDLVKISDSLAEPRRDNANGTDG